MKWVKATLPSILQPQQQQEPAGETMTNSQAGASGTFGSMGPFFAVISVLAVLAILSCYLGRICTANDSGCLGWLKRKCCRRSVGGDVEVGPCVMVKDGETHQQHPS
ncbi:Protein spire 2 like [Quillaja saponaria]|uniref:Protein spire 2 like n=1 Tax=Quillaja saponaria TaxID=32244 RepID=A0AAD7QC50_QUISA|nr:Protein spire 2 like [Quillaja saponaria]